MNFQECIDCELGSIVLKFGGKGLGLVQLLLDVVWWKYALYSSE